MAQRVQVNIRIDIELRDRINSYLARKRMCRFGDKNVFLEKLLLEGMNRREASEKSKRPV